VGGLTHRVVARFYAPDSQYWNPPTPDQQPAEGRVRPVLRSCSTA